MPGESFSQPIDLTIAVENKSNEPALYSIVNIYFDKLIKIVNPDEIKGAIYNDAENRLQRNLLIPDTIPIFKSMKCGLFSDPIKILIPFDSSNIERVYSIRWEAIGHGMNNVNDAYLFIKGNELTVIVS